MDKRIHDAFYNEELTKVIEDIPVKTGDPESVTITGINIMAIDPELKLPYCGTASIYYVPRNLAVFENYDLIRAITMMTMVEPVSQKVLCGKIGLFLKNKLNPFQYIISIEAKHLDIINRKSYKICTMSQFSDKEMSIDPTQMQYFINKDEK